MSFGSDLRKARERRGLSRAQLVTLIRAAFAEEKVSLSRHGIRNIEIGKTKAPRSITVEKIAKVLAELSQYITK